MKTMKARLSAAFLLATAAVGCGDTLLGAHEDDKQGPSSPDGSSAQQPDAGGTLGGPRIGTFCVGQNHSCIARAGTAKCWGANGDGQLGDGTTTDRATPVDVASVQDVVELGCSTSYTCARSSSGVVSCWGKDSNGFLGWDSPQPPTTFEGLDQVARLYVGPAHSCVVRTSGDVLCWGWDIYGQIGDGQFTQTVATPTKVAGLTDVVEMTLGFQHTCALHADQTVSCWGDNDGGQLGDGTFENRAVPTKIPGLTGVTRLSHGGLAGGTCAIRVDGFARCWGLNQMGEVGDGTFGNRSSPTPMTILGARTIVDVSMGSTTCATDETRTAHCWGSNAYGQVGNGMTSNRAVQTPFALTGLGRVRRLESGAFHSCAQTDDDQVFCWGGDNGAGQLGNGTTVPSLVPVKALLL